MDVQAVRVALASAAGAIAGLRTTAYVPESVSPPAFFVESERIDFDAGEARSLDVAVFECVLLVGMAANRSGQEALTPYLAGSGASSLKTALETARDSTSSMVTSGAADDLRVESVDGHRVFTVGGTDYWGAKFSVRVWG